MCSCSRAAPPLPFLTSSKSKIWIWGLPVFLIGVCVLAGFFKEWTEKCWMLYRWINYSPFGNTGVVLSLLFKNQVLWLRLLEQFLWAKKKKKKNYISSFQNPFLLVWCTSWKNNWLTPRSVGKDGANRIRLMGTYGNYNCEKTTWNL